MSGKRPARKRTRKGSPEGKAEADTWDVGEDVDTSGILEERDTWDVECPESWDMSSDIVQQASASSSHTQHV